TCATNVLRRHLWQDYQPSQQSREKCVAPWVEGQHLWLITGRAFRSFTWTCRALPRITRILSRPLSAVCTTWPPRPRVRSSQTERCGAPGDAMARGTVIIFAHRGSPQEALDYALRFNAALEAHNAQYGAALTLRLYGALVLSDVN